MVIKHMRGKKLTPVDKVMWTAAFVLFSILALISATVPAADIPKPVRDSDYDWRCVNPDGSATRHQRPDTAIYACQNRAAEDPGKIYYIQGGTYRVLVGEVPLPDPDPDDREEPPPDLGNVVPDDPGPLPERDGSMLLEWEAPTQQVVGNGCTGSGPDVDLSGYVVHYSSTSRGVDVNKATPMGDYYSSNVRLDDADITSYVLEDLQKGKRYWVALQAVDTDGGESCLSNEVKRRAT